MSLGDSSYRRRIAYRATLGLICDCRLLKLSVKEPFEGKVVIGTKDSFSIVTRRANVDVDESKEPN